jgi:NADH-quinone oxidoreductase subunit G
MSDDMIHLTIDGIPVEAPRGTTILQAAEIVGIHIPRYCYHPGLEIVGICRICQVEIEGNPKPTIACYTQIAEGQKVLTKSPMVERARRSDLEFLLINHPIDCPICDTSGECDLQNYYMTDGKHKSRLRYHKINRKKKKRIGQKVVLDQERCILCSRCVRFLKDVTGTHELGFFGRGVQSYIDIVEGRSLEGNLYAGNVIDLCPVGALTDDEFRFKCRVWYLSTAPSLCPHCANGCNIDVHFNIERCWLNDGKRIMRIKPRHNPHVNDYWMCDLGRYNYDFAEAPSRIKRPLILPGGSPVEVAWKDALGVAAQWLREAGSAKGASSIALIPSPWLTNEAAYIMKKLFIDSVGVGAVGFRKGEGEKGGDGLLLRNDRNPNRLGLELIGLDGGEGGLPRPAPACPGLRSGDSDPGIPIQGLPRTAIRGLPRDEVLRKAAAGTYAALVYVQDLPDRVPPVDLIEAAVKGAGRLIVLASNESDLTKRAGLVLPISPWSEDHGTWVNWRGRLQWLTPALPPTGYARIASEALALLAERMGYSLGDGKPRSTFEILVHEVPEFRGISWDDLKGFGVPLAGYSGTKREDDTKRAG